MTLPATLNTDQAAHLYDTTPATLRRMAELGKYRYGRSRWDGT